MLGHRHQFDVGIAEIQHVGNQLGRKFAPAVEAAVGMPTPGTGMQFVDADGPMLPVEVGARVHPAAVLPGIEGVVGDAAGGLGTHEHLARIGIGLAHQLAMSAENFIFVGVAGIQTWDEQLPDTRCAAAAHRMTAAIPLVEIADHADTLHRRGPYGKQAPRHAVDGLQARTQHLPGLEMPPFAEQIEIHFAQLRTEAVGTLHGVPFARAFVLPAQQRVRLHCSAGRQDPLEAVGAGDACHRPARRFHSFGGRQEGTDQHAAVRLGMQAQHFERIMVRTGLHAHDRRADCGHAGVKWCLPGGMNVRRLHG